MSATPWKVREVCWGNRSDGPNAYEILDAKGDLVAEFSYTKAGADIAELIVRAVNTHDRLLLAATVAERSLRSAIAAVEVTE